MGLTGSLPFARPRLPVLIRHHLRREQRDRDDRLCTRKNSARRTGGEGHVRDFFVWIGRQQRHRARSVAVKISQRALKILSGRRWVTCRVRAEALVVFVAVAPPAFLVP